MASTKAFRVSAPGGTATQVVGSDAVDRRVLVRVESHSAVRLAFASGDLPNDASGFLLPAGSTEFTLQAGDEIWLIGQQVDENGYLYFLITKE